LVEKASKVKLNVSKTKCLVITKTATKLNQLSADMTKFPVKIDGTNIEYVNSIKYLGVQIDNHLKFDQHIDYVIKKASTKISYLGRLSRILDKKILEIVMSIQQLLWLPEKPLM
jgi:hypothetical protein